MQVTVAIPTVAGRSHYLQASLRTCVAQDVDFEILVSDNSAQESRDLVESFRDSRIRYITPPRYLPMAAHWDFVLGHVRGDLLTIIGDDDGLMPRCIERVSELADAAGDMPIHHSLANYRWPDFVVPEQRNTVVFLDAAGTGETVKRSATFLSDVAKGMARYVDGPMVYHNFIPMRLLRQLTQSGVFFRRSSPDVYSALAIAANAPAFLCTREVLTLSGQGAKANGASIQSGAGQTFLLEAQSLYTPRFKGRSVQLALLDSLLEVIEHYGRPDSREIDYASHFAAAIIEARYMQHGTRRQELRWLMAAAEQQQVRTRTMGCLLTRIGRHLVSSRASPPVGVVHARGKSIAMPAETKTIYDAAQSLHHLMTPRLSA
jgi:hypothetical protein